MDDFGIILGSGAALDMRPWLTIPEQPNGVLPVLPPDAAELIQNQGMVQKHAI
jgi:hypothetical protein